MGGMSKTTPNGLFSFSANSQSSSSSSNEGNVNVMDVFENQKENFVLRPIEQNDLLIALKHIKSTMKAHNDHKMKYGTNNKNPLFNNLGLFGLNPTSKYNSNIGNDDDNDKDERNDSNVNNNNVDNNLDDDYNDELEME